MFLFLTLFVIDRPAALPATSSTTPILPNSSEANEDVPPPTITPVIVPLVIALPKLLKPPVINASHATVATPVASPVATAPVSCNNLSVGIIVLNPSLSSIVLSGNVQCGNLYLLVINQPYDRTTGIMPYDRTTGIIFNRTTGIMCNLRAMDSDYFHAYSLILNPFYHQYPSLTL